MMGDRSKIEWTDATWNPIRARNARTGAIGWYCEKVSQGCANCYAEALNRRRGTRLSYVPLGLMQVGAFLDEETLLQPLRWKRPRMVFPCSMSDLFGDWVSTSWIDRVFAVMALASNHTFQVLTKRSTRMREYVTDVGVIDRVRRAGEQLRPSSPPRHWYHINDWAARLSRFPPDNVWLGVSAEDHETLNSRVPDLISTPARIRFISAEPLLGPLDFMNIYAPQAEHIPGRTLGIQWVIVGGESGASARGMSTIDAWQVVRQCREADIPVFVKQLGTIWSRSKGLHKKDPKGGDMEHWPYRLRVREMPT